MSKEIVKPNQKILPRPEQSVDVYSPHITNEDVQEMAAIAERVKSKNTTRTYKNALKKLQVFCVAKQMPDFLANDGLILNPATPSLLVTFAKELAYNKNGVFPKAMKFTTINLYINGIASTQQKQGFENPLTPPVKEQLLNIKKDLAQGQKQAKPITYKKLIKVVSAIDVSTNRGKRDKAIILTGFLGCLRRSEIVALKHNDSLNTDAYITEDLEEGFTIGYKIILKKYKKSTGDPHERFLAMYPQNPKGCPVRALKHWFEVADFTEGHLFLSIDKHDNIKPGVAIVGDTVNRIVKRYFGKRYSGHSFRTGFATSASNRDVPLEHIRTHGGWKSDAMPRRYKQKANIKNNKAIAAFSME